MAAFSQKAELNQACLSGLFCSGFGHEQTKTGLKNTLKTDAKVAVQRRRVSTIRCNRLLAVCSILLHQLDVIQDE
jgi:hypothetical protein